MPRFPGYPERPYYNSVKAYLSELAKDIAEMVVDPVKVERFREQLETYAGFWQEWKIAEDTDQNGCWKPEMGRPECIFNVFSRSYSPLNEPEKEIKRLAGAYALCALIHDSQLPHLDKINTDIIPIEAIEETLSSPRNTLEDSIVGNWNSGPDVREIYLIEEFFNRVTVDLQELCKSEENKSTQLSIEGQIQQASQLSDKEFLELTAKKFEELAKKVLSKDETWHNLDRSLKGWFDSAIARLEKQGFKDKTNLLKYLYKNLLHYARNINIKSFRGFPDSKIVGLASKVASELAGIFKEFAHKNTVSLEEAKAEIPTIDKRKTSETERKSLQGIIEILKNWQKSKKTDKDFKVAKAALSPIANIYDILCRHRGQCGAKATNVINWLGSATNHGSGLCPALLNDFACPVVIADLEKWQEKPAEKADKQDKATTTSQPNSIVGDTWTILGIPINIKKLCAKLKHHPFLLTCSLSVIIIIATSPLWYPLINKTDHDSSANYKPKESKVSSISETQTKKISVPNPSLQKSVGTCEVIDILKLFVEDIQGWARWETGAQPGTPIAWITEGKYDDPPKDMGSTFGAFARHGVVVLTIQGKPIYQQLKQTVVPGVWEIWLVGPNAGVSVVKIESEYGKELPFDISEILSEAGFKVTLYKGLKERNTTGNFIIYRIESLAGGKAWLAESWSIGTAGGSQEIWITYQQRNADTLWEKESSSGKQHLLWNRESDVASRSKTTQPDEDKLKVTPKEICNNIHTTND